MIVCIGSAMKRIRFARIEIPANILLWMGYIGTILLFIVFPLVPGVIDDSGNTILELHLEPGQRLIYRRRHAQTIGKPLITVTIVGWQQTIAGQNVQSIAYVFEDGRIELAGRWKEDHPWFYSPQLLSFEK